MSLHVTMGTCTDMRACRAEWGLDAGGLNEYCGCVYLPAIGRALRITAAGAADGHS